MANHDVGVVVNDLPCFAQNKLECFPVENRKPNIIVGGFKEEAILTARDVLFEGLQGHEKLNLKKKTHRQTGKSYIGELNVQDLLTLVFLCRDVSRPVVLYRYNID